MEFLDLTVPEVVLRLLLGMAIGFCIGLTGVGGGVLVLPTLTLILRVIVLMLVLVAAIMMLGGPHTPLASTRD